MPDGSVRIVDVWESEDRVDEFERARLIPAFAAVGALTGPPQRDVSEPFHLIR